ncbi:hypothetical protein O7627_15095 [Solwaraspora sp. WMMD1047]|uniref:hypothetical protein n=1 Tax=Solwaraspora sp. WMMD1047 TaxID=3016102 RepID=UPI0024180C00|nr:hypothetical protein [Solwaraspora sp. WMMD1047]MDG4830618.1 hypothetical protein [Solwaraspora sp. WMMD1047]
MPTDRTWRCARSVSLGDEERLGDGLDGALPASVFRRSHIVPDEGADAGVRDDPPALAETLGELGEALVEFTCPGDGPGEQPVGRRRAEVTAHGLAVEVQRVADCGGADAPDVRHGYPGVPLSGHLGAAPLRTIG